ncbi:DUF2254 domain-containing protein [Exiguobacterium sp. SH3S2]|uniref:DUF2254 domain-containing protein n=1 Tax=unclassified Exiguobacterium TaxID=2644629 RepID=UPI00103F495F|nr:MULTISPECIES: DUF2254 domain-containing protein [unclassified Exiguobacterium]TCI26540.1 DUF2254 domain-containing protein [Exiguobacterium sp. SH5S4]TCI49089.1 DUF2254 domain-containing protein [Exiguobacterium sp. SH3S3]TCI58119.1 DUF2254 domain-containing protein [Exiguobacterium sp. SH5S13]TCI64402.1 DUF2254 domain-containing protein [Exiguobacterium sp. SH3S2]TCI66272.1 DUF2254 domain-containing protein [Exiguobacterium sp. SH3S1]
MFKRLQLMLSDSTWFVPFLYGTGGIVLTFLTQYFGSFFRELLPKIIYLDQDSAASVLSSSFTSLMTMMTFSFSTILVVLTTYSSQFSPRTINNFLTNSASKHTLGIFIMTTVYGITNLFLIRTSEEDAVLASGVSVVLVVSSIWAFVKFIQTISVSIQAERLLSSLHREALSVIVKQKQAVEDGKVSIVLKRSVHTFETGQAVYASRTGYVQLFSSEKQEDHDISFESVVAVGDFVAEGDILGYWLGDDALDKDVFQIGEVRSSIQDPAFVIEKLSEIALKGVSPGINDPNTAIHAIHYIGDILRELSELPEGDFVFSNGKSDWHIKRKAMEATLFEALAPIKTYASHDIFVMASIFEAIRIGRLRAHPTHHDTFEEFVDYIEDVLAWDDLHPREKAFLTTQMMQARKIKA